MRAKVSTKFNNLLNLLHYRMLNPPPPPERGASLRELKPKPNIFNHGLPG